MEQMEASTTRKWLTRLEPCQKLAEKDSATDVTVEGLHSECNKRMTFAAVTVSVSE
jgi:hypothetical protein